MDRAVQLGFRIANVDLRGTDWSGRILDGMEFVNCDLSGARFDDATIRQIAFQSCKLKGATFNNALPHSVQFDYGPRLFGTAVMEALRARGVAQLEDEEQTLEDLEQDWRVRVKDLLTSRMRRFYVGGTEGSKGSRWDTSILELNLLGGLNQYDRRYASSELLPKLVRDGVLIRAREHGNVVYRLSDDAKDDARRLIEDGKVSGMMEAVLERLSAVEPTTAVHGRQRATKM
jgi:Pentapeptide repeats (9 copies)